MVFRRDSNRAFSLQNFEYFVFVEKKNCFLGSRPSARTLDENRLVYLWSITRAFLTAARCICPFDFYLGKPVEKRRKAYSRQTRKGHHGFLPRVASMDSAKWHESIAGQESDKWVPLNSYRQISSTRVCRFLKHSDKSYLRRQ